MGWGGFAVLAYGAFWGLFRLGFFCLCVWYFSFFFKEIQYEQPGAKTHSPSSAHCALSIYLQRLRSTFTFDLLPILCEDASTSTELQMELVCA